MLYVVRLTDDGTSALKNGYDKGLSSLHFFQAAYGFIADNVCCSGRSKQPQQTSLDC